MVADRHGGFCGRALGLPVSVAASLLLISLVHLLWASGCRKVDKSAFNKVFVSPSGKYSAWNGSGRHPNYADTPVHVVTIYGKDDSILYRDTNSHFVGILAVYAAWDADDRFWLYCSDDGSVWVFEMIDGRWRKEKWGYSSEKETSRDIEPPQSLYPT